MGERPRGDPGILERAGPVCASPWPVQDSGSPWQVETVRFTEPLPRGRRRAKCSQARPWRKGPISRMRKPRLRDAKSPTQGLTVELGCELEGVRLYVLSLANPHPGQSKQWKLIDKE